MTTSSLITEMLICSIINEAELKGLDKDKAKSVANRKKIQETIKKYKK